MRLQGKLLLSIVPAIAISLAMLGVTVYSKLNDGVEREQQFHLSIAMDRVQAASLAYVDMNELNASLLADVEPIANYFRALNETPEHIERTRAAVRSMFRRMKRRVPDFKELRLLARDGQELIRVADAGLENLSQSEAGTDWFLGVGHNWSAALHTDVVQHPDDGAMALMIARPVEQADSADTGPRPTQHLRGYLVIAARLDFLNREIDNHSFGENARILVLDPTGRAAFDAHDGGGAHETGSAHELDRAPPLALASLERALAERAPLASGQDVPVSDRIDVAGRSFTVVQRPLFGTMTIVAIVPDTASEQLAAGLAKSVAAVTLVSIAVATVLFYMLLRALLLSPIRSLQHSAMEIERGEDVRLLMVGSRNDELGELATAFDRMHQRLTDSVRAVQASHARTERLAFEDRLTGLCNRLWLMTQLDERVTIARARGRRFAVLLINLDGFKRINERFGLDVGDSLLRETATRLSHCIAKDDSTTALARLGGDEFVVVLECVDEAEGLAGGIAEALATPIELSGQRYVTQIGIGMAVYPDDATVVHELLRSADLALGVAKGREQGFQRYDQSIRDGIEYRQRLEFDLRSAVEGGVLALQYQPQINVASGRVQGVEALLRWQHAELGFIPPEVFIPIAEETGLIAEIGRGVMQQACEQWMQWQSAGIAPDRISINISPRQFQLGDVVAEVREQLTRLDVPASALEVELTESGVADADDDLIAALKRFGRMGVRVAMDDFGKGISTLGALAALPIDTLKIDRSFVTDVDKHPRTEKVLGATLALIESLGLEGVAEGVETEAEFRWLEANGCTIVQGYYFSRPLWGPDMTDYLSERKKQDERRAA